MEEKWTRVVIHDSHGNVIADRPLSPEGATEQVAQHNADPDAHPAIREAIVGLRTQVGRRLVGAKVKFSDGHTEDVELGVNDQGEVILLLPKETFGKIDGVLVNGEELPVDDNGKVDITIPTSVSELEDANDYATKEEAQAMVDEAKVTGASVDYQEDGGSPSASVDYSEGSLGFTLKNMKMKFSDLSPEEVVAITGPQGIPGEGAIWTGSGEEIMTLEQETGNSIGKAMSQKAVTEMGERLSASMATESLYWQRQSTLPTVGYLNNLGNWYVADGYTHAHFSAEGVKFIKITGNAERSTLLAFLRSYTEPNNGEPADLCSDVVTIRDGATKMLEVPDGCAYIAVTMMAGANSMAPQLVYVGRHIEKNADTLSAKEGTLRQRYSGCALCIIGDSISTYQGDVPDGATYHYPQKGIASLDMMYYKRLVDNLGFKSYQNLSYGGSGAVRYDQSVTHPSLFERAMLVQSADVVIIELGLNDFGHQVPIGVADYDTAIEDMGETTFCDAYIKGLKELMRKLPEAQILLMLIEERKPMNASQYPISCKDYQDAVRNIAAHYGLMVIDASQAYSTYGYSDAHPRMTEMELLYNSCVDNLLEHQNEGERKNRAKVNEILTPIDFDIYQALDYYLYVDGLWYLHPIITTAISKVINIEPGKKYRLQATNTSPVVGYVLSNPNYRLSAAATFATGMTPKKAIVAQAGEYVDFISPDDGHYLYFALKAVSSGSVIDRTPQAIYRVDEADLSAVKAVADNYFSKGGGTFSIGGANINDGTLDNSNTKLAKTDFIACAGILNISVDVPDEMSVDGAFLLKYNEGEFVEAVVLDVSNLGYNIKVSGFTHAILRLYNSNGYTAAQWRTISYSYSTGMRYLIGSAGSSSIEDMRIDYVRSIQTKTKVLEIEDNEMIPTTGTCITTHDGHLYVSIDGVKYEITKTQVQ